MGEKEYLFCSIAQQTNTYTQLTIEPEKLWNMFNVNNKDTVLVIGDFEEANAGRDIAYWFSEVVLVSFIVTLNRFHTFFFCLHCWLWTSKCRLGCVFWKSWHHEKLSAQSWK